MRCRLQGPESCCPRHAAHRSPSTDPIGSYTPDRSFRRGAGPPTRRRSRPSRWRCTCPTVRRGYLASLMLFCTGPKSGRPSSSIFARCQFSLNQPRLSPCTGRSNTSKPGMFVSVTFSFFSKSIFPISPSDHSNADTTDWAMRDSNPDTQSLPSLTDLGPCSALRSRP